MRFYLANGQYVGTQADAKRLDRTFQPVDVPTDKDGLMAYLNDLTSKVDARAYGDGAVAMSQAIREDAPPESQFSAKSVIAQMDAHREQLTDRSARLTALEEAIQNADGFELSSLLANVISRLEELRREAKLRNAA